MSCSDYITDCKITVACKTVVLPLLANNDCDASMFFALPLFCAQIQMPLRKETVCELCVVTKAT